MKAAIVELSKGATAVLVWLWATVGGESIYAWLWGRAIKGMPYAVFNRMLTAALRVSREQEWAVRLFVVGVLLVTTVGAAAMESKKRRYEYTCPRCHKVELYEDAIPQARYCEGTDDKPHSRQKMQSKLQEKP